MRTTPVTLKHAKRICSDKLDQTRGLLLSEAFNRILAGTDRFAGRDCTPEYENVDGVTFNLLRRRVIDPARVVQIRYDSEYTRWSSWG
jgi:hypothetical protein